MFLNYTVGGIERAANSNDNLQFPVGLPYYAIFNIITSLAKKRGGIMETKINPRGDNSYTLYWPKYAIMVLTMDINYNTKNHGPNLKHLFLWISNSFIISRKIKTVYKNYGKNLFC